MTFTEVAGRTGPRVRVALLFGGWGGAYGGGYEASCVSGSAVLDSLDPAIYEVLPVHLCRGGQWVAGPESVASTLMGAGPEALAAALAPNKGSTYAASIRSAANLLREVDVAFPAMHGVFGADGTLQSVLDGLGVPYVGSGVVASAAGQNRVVTKRLAAAEGIAVASAIVLRPGFDTLTKAQQDRLGLPVFVKPARGGSSWGITRIEQWDDLPAAVAAARAGDSLVLVEECIAGVAYEVAVVEREDGRLDVTGSGGPENVALQAFHALGCAGLLQVGATVRDGKAVLTEVDTSPSLAPSAPFPRLWNAAGIDFPMLLDMLVRSAIALQRPARATRRGQRAPFHQRGSRTMYALAPSRSTT